MLKNLTRRIGYVFRCMWPYNVNPNNKHYDRQAGLTRPIHIFYHIFCGENDYLSIVKEQVELMYNSGLMDVVTKVNVVIIGNQHQIRQVKSLFPHEKLNVILETEDGSCFEFPILRYMRNMAQSKSFYALYLHTKGASLSRKKYIANKIRHEYGTYDQIARNVESWRRLMDYFCIEKWRTAVNVLNHGYLYYGCLLKTVQPCWKDAPHYSGNFWWTASEALIRTKSLDEITTTDRYNAEFWLVRDVSKAYNTVSCPIVLYAVDFKRSLYTMPWYTPSNLVYSVKHMLKFPIYLYREVHCL